MIEKMGTVEFEGVMLTVYKDFNGAMFAIDVDAVNDEGGTFTNPYDGCEYDMRTNE